jgi:hypothetical protein
MDIFAHAIWTNVLARVAKRQQEKRHARLVSLAWATFWGVFPDLFAFTIPFIIGIVHMITQTGEGFGRSAIATGIAPILYQYSHSLVIWAVVFGVTWVVSKRPRWELLGWALHILIDIPSHANGFYLTPVFFPISGWKFTHGVSWGNPIYMMVNYSLMLIAWISIVILKRKKS